MDEKKDKDEGSADDNKTKEKEGCHSKTMSNSSKIEDEDKDDGSEKEKDNGCLGVDKEELRLMIRNKSPSTIKCEQEELTKREAVLLIGIFISITCVLTVALIITGALRDKNKCLEELDNITTSMIKYRDEPRYCLNNECMQIATAIAQSRGSIDPCKDFYGHTCAHWSKSHPHAVGDWSAKDELRRRIKVDVLKQLKMLATNDKSTSTRRVKELFNSCMDTESIDAGGNQVMLDAIASVGGWNLKSGWIQKSIEDILVMVHSRYWVHALFKVEVTPDPMENGRYIIQLSRGDLILPSVLDYKSEMKRDVLRNYIATVARLLGISPNNAKDFARNVYVFDEGIAKVQVQSYMAETRTERLTLQDLELVSPELSNLNWLKYLKTAGYQVTEKSAVLVSNKIYLQAVSAILRAANRTTFNNYVVWRLVHALSSDAPRDFRLAAVEYEMNMNDHAKPRWEHCYDDVHEWYPMTIGRMYSSQVKHSSNLNKLIATISDHLKSRIANLTMDDDIKEKILGKLNTVRIEITASLLEKEVDMMDTVYSFLYFTSSDTYQEKIGKLIRATTQRMTEIYSDPQIVTNEWPISSTDIEPFYCRHKNKLYVPAGSLSAPIYDDRLPVYYNYASYGSLIARELLKAVDPQGLDDAAIEVPSWIAQDSEKYAASYGCMTRYLAQWKTPNVTASALVADTAAFRLAFESYAANGGREALPLAGLDQSIDAMFYTSYVTAQCGGEDRDGERLSMVFAHLDDFVLAFKCPANERSNPSEKCSLFNW